MDLACSLIRMSRDESSMESGSKSALIAVDVIVTDKVATFKKTKIRDTLQVPKLLTGRGRRLGGVLDRQALAMQWQQRGGNTVAV